MAPGIGFGAEERIEIDVVVHGFLVLDARRRPLILDSRYRISRPNATICLSAASQPRVLGPANRVETPPGPCYRGAEDQCLLAVHIQGLNVVRALVGSIEGRTVVHVLTEGEQTVGRATTCDVSLPVASISRTHAKLTLTGGRVTVEDLGSTYGTFVNGTPVAGPRELRVGDTLKLADTELRLVETAPPERTIYREEEGAQESSAVTLDEVIGQSNLFRVLAEAGELLATRHSLDNLYGLILDLVEKVAPCDKAVLLLTEEEGGEPVVKASRVKPGAREGDLVLSRTMVRKVLEEKTGILTSDAQQDPRFQSQQSIITQGIRSAMAAPLFDNEKVIGLLYADTADPASWYNMDALRTFTALANLIAVKITQARLEEAEEEQKRLAREVQSAKDILAYILPAELASTAGYELRAYHRPCLEVGGDLYDVKNLRDGRMLFLTGDVAGKGLGAALLVSNIMPIVSVLMEEPQDLTDVVRRLNRQIYLSTDPVHYATLFLGILDPETGDVEYVNAGHNPPYLVRPGHEIEEVPATSVPIGMLEGAPFESGRLTIEPGGLLFLFSDGIPEAQDKAGDFYEEERLKKLIDQVRERSADEISASVRADLQTFVGDASPTDDITMLLLKRASG
jgi:sigma-B regulation protein RsbU (phosphoserine phosphatase)